MTLSGSARRGLRVQRHVDYVAYEQSDGGVRQRAQRRAGSRVGASGFEGTLVRGWRREVNRAGADCAPKSRDRLWLDRPILMLLMSAVYPGNGSLPFRKRGCRQPYRLHHEQAGKVSTGATKACQRLLLHALE